jgi:hypothetical protein
MEFVNKEISGEPTIHSDVKAVIAPVSHPGTEPDQDCAIKVVTAAQTRKERGSRTSIEWVPGDTGIEGNDRVDQLAGEAGKISKLAEPQLPGIKRGFRHTSLWPRTHKLKGGKTRSSPQPLKSHS